MTSLLFGIIRNEDMDWLAEWIRYHLAIGFDHILLYDNNNGLENYPMPDEIISYCTGDEAKVQIIQKRNKRLDLNYEFSNLPAEYNSYDFKIMLNTNEFIVIKTEEQQINMLLEDEKIGFDIEVIPYDVTTNGEETIETLNLEKYKCYFPKYMKKSNTKESKKTDKLYIKKILSVQ